MVEKAQLPEPQPYPEDWKKRLLSMSREQLIAQTEEAEAREAAAVSLPAPPADDGETVEAIDLPF